MLEQFLISVKGTLELQATQTRVNDLNMISNNSFYLDIVSRISDKSSLIKVTS